MTLYRKLPSLTVLLIVPICAIAQSPDLIADLSGTDEPALREKNSYFLSKHLYASKRHRLVDVNVDLIQGDEPFVIRLFNDEVLEVEPKSIDVRWNGLIIRWKGTIKNPPLSVKDLMAHFPSEELARQAHQGLFEVSITAARFEHDAESGANLPYWGTRDKAGRLVETEEEVSSKGLFWGITARVEVPGSNRTFVLSPMDFGGPRHLVYEVDPEKIVNLPDDQYASASTDNDKVQARQAFLDSLGEDPRVEIVRKKEMEKSR